MIQRESIVLRARFRQESVSTSFMGQSGNVCCVKLTFDGFDSKELFLNEREGRES